MRSELAVFTAAIVVSVAGMPVAAQTLSEDAGEDLAGPSIEAAIADGTLPSAADAPAVPGPEHAPEPVRPYLGVDPADRGPATARLAEALADHDEGALAETLRDRFADELPEPDTAVSKDRSLPELPGLRERLATERARLLEMADRPSASPSDASPVTASLEVPSSETFHDTPCEGHPPHPPIRITEDEGPDGFVVGHDPVTGQPVYRPGSGVVAGTGTADDPYVIAPWCITAADPTDEVEAPVTGIEIRDTSAHVEIHDVLVRLPIEGSIGVRLDGADNVTLRRNEVGGNDLGVVVEDSSGIALRGNSIVGNRQAGVVVDGSEGARLRNNRIRDNDGPGVLLSGSSGSELVSNRLRYNEHTGADIVDSPGTRAAENEITGEWVGLFVDTSPDSTLTRNEIEETGYGVALVASDGSGVTDNDIEDYGGILVLDSDRSHVAGNTVHDDVAVRRSNRTTVEGNTILGGGGYGFFDGAVEVEDSRDVTITDNVVLGDGGLYGSGIRVSNANGTTITENTVRADIRWISLGVVVYNSDGLLLADNTVDDSGGLIVGAGVVVVRAEDPTLTRNRVRDSGEAGVVLAEVEDAVVTDNAIEDNGEVGLGLFRAGGSVVEDNRLVGGGLWLRGDARDDFTQASVSGNTVNGQPLVYVEDAVGVDIGEPAGQVVLVDVAHATVDGVSADNATVGVQAAYSDVTIRNASLDGNVYGVLGTDLEPFTLTGSHVADSTEDGIRLDRAWDASVTDNEVTGSTEEGIVVTRSSDLLVARNTVTDAGAWFSAGIAVRGSGAEVVDNAVADSYVGVAIGGPGGARVANNTVTGSDEAGLRLDGAPGNVVEDNRFEGNGLQILGDAPAEWNQSVTGNTVNGEPLVYVRDATGAVVDEPAGQVILANVSTTRVANLSLTNATIGIQAAFSDDVTIRNVTLTGNEIGVVGQQLNRSEISDSRGAGVVLRGSNGTIVAGNEVTEGRYGIVATRSRGIEIVGNVLGPGDVYGLGAGVYDSRRVEIADNRIEIGGGYYASGVVVYGSDRVDVTSGEIVGDGGRWGSGVWVGRSSRVVVADATIQQTGVGVSVVGSEEVEVRDSTIEDLGWTGVGVDGSYFYPPSEDVEIHHNRIANASIGVWAEEGDGIEIVANDITESRVAGIILYEDVHVEDNNIWDNDVGLYGSEVTAQHNWWGCPAGPEAPLCDDVEGDVDYVPWRVTANPDAGPR